MTRAASAARRRPGGLRGRTGGPACGPGEWPYRPAARRHSSRRCVTAGPASRTELYWAARLTLVNRAEDLAAFDAVFGAVFGDAFGSAGSARARGASSDPERRRPASAGATTVGRAEGGGLPWTHPAGVDARRRVLRRTEVALPDVLPSRLAARADEAFERFDDGDLRLHRRLAGAGRRALAAAAQPAPRAAPARQAHRPAGDHASVASTGFQMVRLARTRAPSRPRRVVLVCDVSRSMQPYVTIYLHLMRAVALRRRGFGPRCSPSRRR